MAQIIPIRARKGRFRAGSLLGVALMALLTACAGTPAGEPGTSASPPTGEVAPPAASTPQEAPATAGVPAPDTVQPDERGTARLGESAVVQPGAPGDASRVVGASTLTGAARIPHTEGDVRFMRDMIHHHAQALDMAALVPTRTEREDIQLLSRRIEVSQASEIQLMRRWLLERGEEAPDPLGMHGGVSRHQGEEHGAHVEEHQEHQAQVRAAAHEGMPGMLSPEQMEALAAASGEEFDRLFLEFMVLHHEGALTMVRQLFASPGAGQSAEIFEFASHVDSDQRIEVARMEQMLRAF